MTFILFFFVRIVRVQRSSFLEIRYLGSFRLNYGTLGLRPIDNYNDSV